MKRFFKIFLPLLMLVLTAIPWVMAKAMADYVHAPIGISGFMPLLGDSLLPLALMTAALFLSSRVLAAAAVLFGIATAGLKTAALLFYQQALLPFNSRSVALIWAHTDHAGMSSFLGANYLWWMLPALLLAAVFIALCCFAAWKTVRTIPHRKNRGAVFAFLLCLSLAAVICHEIDVHRDPQEIYSGHLVTPLPSLVKEEICELFRKQPAHETVSPESRKILTKMKMLPLPSDSGKEALFDKIIIIAVESLDLDFIGACNKRMPQGITPELDRLMQEFPHLLCYYTAAQPTSWGLSALLLSRLDFERDTRNGSLPSLFTEAAKRGYRSYYFSPLSGLFGDNRKLYQELFGTQKQYFSEEWQKEFHLVPRFQWGLSDPELYDGVLRVLHRDKAEKFIALVSTMDTHPDYTAAGAAADDPRFRHDPFLNALHAADFNLGEFLRKLTADREIYSERTLIVVTADHTATHGRNYLKRAAYLPERIPFLFLSRQNALFEKIPQRQFASSIDLAPTLLHLIGAEIPSSFMGNSLFDGKNIAVSRTLDDELIVRSPKGEMLIELRKAKPETQPARAFYEWFRAAY